MNTRTLVGIFKANLPQYLWIALPLYIGGIIFALEGGSPDWGPIIIFFITVTLLYGIAEFANTYADRYEDPIFVPSSPLLTGELSVKTARTAFILQNIIGVLLLIILLAITSNYALFVAVAAGWIVGLVHSMPPFRFKETVLCPFTYALGLAISALCGFLAVKPELSTFALAFGGLMFVECLSFAISATKLRKTFDAFKAGQIKLPEGQSIWNLQTSGLGMKVKTAVALEIIIGLASFALVPIFWRLGYFDWKISIALLSVPFVLMLLIVVLRLKDPLKHTKIVEQFSGMIYTFIILSLFGVALSTLIHWGYVILICVCIIVLFNLLYKYVHPFGPAYRAL